MSPSLTTLPKATVTRKVDASVHSVNMRPLAPRGLGKAHLPKQSRPQRLVVRAADDAKETSVAKPPAEAPAGCVLAGPNNKVRQKSSLYFASEQSLTYLDGTLPGDYGWDPLGISDPEGAAVLFSPGWLSYAEVIHGRWAMLGTVGCLAPEALGKFGIIPEDTGLVWWKSGVIPPEGTFDYWCDPKTLFIGEVILMGFAEFRRLQDYRKPGSMGEQYFLGLEQVLGGSGEPSYPGGQFFNMFNLGADNMDAMKLKEIKNGRLAMIAMLGFGLQACFTGAGPVQNLLDHYADPGHINLGSTFGIIGLS